MVGEMVNDLATDANINSYSYNYQFKGGTCLSNAWLDHMNPDVGTDSWTELPNGYDVVVMAEQIPIQEVIYGSPWGCDLTSVTAVDNFYDMAKGGNPNARMYLMEFHNEVDFTGPTPFQTWTQLNQNMRPLWEQVADSVGLINNGQVCIVPVAAAFQAMADSVFAGSFPGITNWNNLFDPNDPAEATIHPTEVTYYLVACVHYASIFGQSPVGLTNETFSIQGWGFDPPTPQQALMMQQIAWEIVSNDPYACLSTANIEELGSSELLIYPNPSNGNVSIESNLSTIQVYDMTGKLINSFNETIKTLNLPTGAYLVHGISENGDSLVKRLIAQ
jgi:hypothetical protein